MFHGFRVKEHKTQCAFVCACVCHSHRFVTNKPMLVCGNTASMVGESWLAPHFTIIGDRAVHYGQFDCSGPKTTTGGAASPSNSAGACGPGGACC